MVHVSEIKIILFFSRNDGMGFCFALQNSNITNNYIIVEIDVLLYPKYFNI